MRQRRLRTPRFHTCLEWRSYSSLRDGTGICMIRKAVSSSKSFTALSTKSIHAVERQRNSRPLDHRRPLESKRPPLFERIEVPARGTSSSIDLAVTGQPVLAAHLER